MTIHKSKGLEFDSVVLPDLDMPLTRPPTLVYRRDPETLEIARISCAPSKVVRMLDPELAAMYDDNAAQEVREALCLLYVGMTRARQSLTMVVPALKARHDGTAWSPRFSLASIARAGLAGPAALYDIELGEELLAHGDPTWHEHPPQSAMAPATESPERVLPKIDLSGQPPRIWRQIAPSSLGDEGEGAAELLGIDEGEAGRRRGIALHALLAQVPWAGDELPANDVLLRVARAAQPSASNREITAYLETFQTIVRMPAVIEALAQPPIASGERLELWQEREFVQIIDGDLVSGKLDRAVLVWKGDALVRAQIVDFKTAQIGKADIPEWAARYAPQVGLYKKALCKMTGLGAKDVAARLVFTHSGATHAV